MKSIYITLISLLLISCSSSRVQYDYDNKKEFSNYTTYNYYPKLNTGLSELDNKRLLTATDSLMKSKGFQLNDNPQLHLNFKSRQYQTPSRKSIGIGIGGGVIGVGGNIPFGGPDQHIQLTLEFIDTSTQQLVWQAEIDDVQNSAYTPENRTHFFYVMMKKILHKYPPKPKK